MSTGTILGELLSKPVDPIRTIGNTMIAINQRASPSWIEALIRGTAYRLRQERPYHGP